jgi:hypothetical protein
VKFEDALLYVELTVPGPHPAGLAAACRAVAEGGGDILQVAGLSEDAAALRGLVASCRGEGMLYVSGSDPAQAAAVGADGVCLDGASSSIAMARTVLGENVAVGAATRGLDGLRLAVEVGADFVLHLDGAGAPAAFAAIGRGAGALLYAAGIESPATAEAVTGAGIFRLGVRIGERDPAAIRSAVAAYARLLGRSV